MKKRPRHMLISAALLFGFLSAGAYFYLQQPKFGQQPQGERLAMIERSPHYLNGEFKNLTAPPVQSGGSAAAGIIRYLFTPKDNPIPPAPIPVIKTDLSALAADEDIVVWLGHSSYFIQLNGKRLLIDPVFSDDAAPIPYANRAFSGSNPYSAEDMPEIDYLLISHDHWDHLDYPTITALQSKVKRAVCGLGVGAHLTRWGYDDAIVHEADWNTELRLDDALAIHVLPAQHYSGRWLTRNQTLWVGFALVSPEQKIFFSGDSGYAPHFAEIGRRFSGFDLAILDNGQYDESWRSIHMTPEDAAQAAQDLQTAALLPAHVGKFSIAYHSWDDPLKRLSAASGGRDFRLITPKIGEPVDLRNRQRQFAAWWETLIDAK